MIDFKPCFEGKGVVNCVCVCMEDQPITEKADLPWAECREALETAELLGGMIWGHCVCGRYNPRFPQWDREHRSGKEPQMVDEQKMTRTVTEPENLRRFMTLMLEMLVMTDEEREEFFEKVHSDLEDRVLNLAGAAALFEVGETTVKRWLREGASIPHQVIGTKRYFSKKAILAWLADGPSDIKSAE